MILIDANVFMYVAGKDHPNRESSRLFLDRVARGLVEAAVDAEVLQEILHRYRAIGRWEDGKRVFDLARQIVPDVIDLDAATLDRARLLLDRYPSLSARDAVHAAAVIVFGAEGFCTWDGDFNVVAEVRALRPADI